MVHALAAAIVLVAPKILRVVDVGIVVVSIPITSIVLASPSLTVCTLIGLLGVRFRRGKKQAACEEHKRCNHCTTYHRGFPL